MTDPTPDSCGFDRHDHTTCIDRTMALVERACSVRKLQLTPIRRRVLEILLQEHRALGAYDILDRLRAEGLGSQPPVVYRALDFLTKHEFAHRIERMNAFVACVHPDQDHAAAFLICRVCDHVAETMTERDAGRLGDTARAAGFEIERAVLEAEGICPNCKDVQP